MLRAHGDRILVQRLDGQGVETMSPGGIVLPAVEWKRGKTKHVADTFRARVADAGPKVAEVLGQELHEGDEVVVYTYADDGHGRVLVGDDTPYGLFVRARDVIAVEGSEAPPWLTPVRLVERDELLAKYPRFGT
jgi:co-chaperonin GroES (HSP10)